MNCNSPPPTVDAPYYFGTHKYPGHFAWGVGMRKLRRKISNAESWLSDNDGNCPPQRSGKQGVVEFEVWKDKPPRCVLAFWDYSIDNRSGSHSTFLLPGELTVWQALEVAREAFPSVFERFKFEIRVRERA